MLFRSYDNKPKATVSLIEGSVTLAATGCPETRIEPGYSIVYHHADQKLFTNKSDEFLTIWANNELRIEDKSLAETVRLLEGWYRMKINVSTSMKNAQYYTLTVRHESPAELLAAMQKIGKFQYKIDEQKITIF